LNAIFQIAYLLGFVIWVLLDRKKVKEQNASRFMFWLINAASLLLFLLISFNIYPAMPTNWLNNTLAPWGRAIMEGIMYVKTTD